jgi:hypothetical protein
MLSVLLAAWLPARGQVRRNTPFGVMFNAAHAPDGNTTPEDFSRGLMMCHAVGGHIAYMHEWQSGEPGRAYLSALVPVFRALNQKIFLQFAPTILGEPQPPTGLAASFSDPLVRSRYLSEVSWLAQFRPDHLVLGAEADLTFYFSPLNAEAYASLYKEAYVLVKRISPQTQVGLSYHLDLLFTTGAFWVVDYMGPQDFIGLTTYPNWLVHNGHVPSVSAIPTSYYDKVRMVFPNRPILFSEVGWPSAGRGSADEQAVFIRHLPRLFANVRPEIVTWTTLSDTRYFRASLLNGIQLESLDNLSVPPQLLFDMLNSMGLQDWDGVEKPAYRAAMGLVF